MNEAKDDFSWPVNGTSRENYEAFSFWFAQHEETVSSCGLVIWGAGSRGTEYASLMLKMGSRDFLFVDSNPKKWGGQACGADIIPPAELDRHRGKIILVSPENSGEIERYLDAHAYQRNQDYFLIETKTDDTYVEEFLRPYYCENLMMGSCEFTAISIHDEDIRCMEDILFQTLGKSSTKILTVHGISLRAQYHIFRAQIKNRMTPKRLILQISMDTLTAKDHLLPYTQHVELLEKLLRTQEEPDEEFLEYVKIARQRSKHLLMEPFKSQDGKEPHSNVKIRNYFQYYYMGNLDRDVEGLVYLTKILDEAFARKVDVLLFVLPVNYQLAEELLGDKFRKKYEENLSKVKEVTADRNIRFLDLSYSVESELFAWPKAPNASLNCQGRKKVTELLCRAIEEMT